MLVAAKELGVRLRPELKAGETFQDELDVDAAIKAGALINPAALMPLWGKLRASRPPESLLRAIVNSLGDRYYGLEALAIASLRERGDQADDPPHLVRYRHGPAFVVLHSTTIARTADTRGTRRG